MPETATSGARDHPAARVGLLDAAADLVLGGRCVACQRPGRVLCRACARALPAGARPARPSPPPPGLAPAWTAGEYAGPVRAALLGHKERRLLGLRRPLGALLAEAVAAAVPAPGPVLLVPVPSRGASVRSRGHDPTAALTRAAAARLRAAGLEAAVVRLLRLRPGVVDQAGLDAGQRADNLSGSMACRPLPLRRLAAARVRAHLVVCDDVLTTGATVREAQRALEAVGLTVAGTATVAATRRRAPAPDGHP